MIRIAVTQFGLEGNTFASGLTEITTYNPEGFTTAQKSVELYDGTKTNLGGAYQGVRDEGAEVVPLDTLVWNGSALAGPMLADQALFDAMDHICAQLREKLDDFDGLLFIIHGAAISQTIDDVESYCYRRVREVIGGKPLMSSLDLHGNISQEMIDLSDGYIGYKCVPHTDLYDASRNAARLLVRKIRGEVNPMMAVRRIPMVLPLAVGSTLSGPAQKVKDHFEAYAKEHGLIDASFFHGFSSADRASTSSSILVVADGYKPDQEAAELARFVWDLHLEFQPESLSAEEAVDLALSKVKGGYVVINEHADNPGSGCPGDSTHLLREFVRRDLPRSIMAMIYDPAAAAVCHKHKVGDHFPLEVGGHSAPVCGEPILFEDVELMGLSDGDYHDKSPVHEGMLVQLGPTARLRSGHVEFVVSSHQIQVFDDSPYIITGAKMEDYDIVGLKSLNHFRGYFGPRADAIVTADTPGLSPARISIMPYEKILRPIFPLDEDVEYNGVWP